MIVDTEIFQWYPNNVIDWSTADNMELHEKKFEASLSTVAHAGTPL